MKKLLSVYSGILILLAIVIALTILLSSCNKDSHGAKLPQDGPVIVYHQNGSKISIITIDNCEYIFYNATQKASITHKGNCNNNLHTY